jgi:predicted Zn-dependent peptidase
MHEQTLRSLVLPNGLTLLLEPMDDVQSAAFTILVPAGSIYDPPAANGTANVLCELMSRGAGSRDSRQLSAALDTLGVQRSESVGPGHMSFSGATLADNLADTLRLYGDILRRPHLPEEEFEAATASVEQTLRSIEDEPRQKMLQELRRRTYPSPWGLPSDGSLADLPNINPATVRRQYERCFRPNGTIIGIAGRIDPKAIVDVVTQTLGDWHVAPTLHVETGSRGPNRDHIPHESTQTHIGIAYDSVPYSHPDYYAAWAAVSVLSGGSSSRLFTEVRERRGLCYSVYATLSTLKHEARILCYAGTTAERAQETLDVTLRELRRIEAGIAEDELERCKARAKSSLIMQQESTMSRSSSIASDWHHLGRVTTLNEVRQKIEALTVETVLDYVHRFPAKDLTVMTLGPNPLVVGNEQEGARSEE